MNRIYAAVLLAALATACGDDKPAVAPVNGACTADNECDKGLVCFGGYCKTGGGGACVSSETCAAPNTCENGICKVPAGGNCHGDKPCVEGYACEADVCKGQVGKACADAIPCQIGLSCTETFCRVKLGGNCSESGDCAAGLTCDGGQCRIPLSGACGANADCAAGLTCDNGACRTPKNGRCHSPAECVSGLACRDSVCRVPVGGSCTELTDCLTGLVCDDRNTCHVPKNGECDAPTDCKDGLLCEGGLCKAPVLAACAEGDCAGHLTCTEGRCLQIAGGPCPTGIECGPLLACDHGTCKVDQGGQCTAGTCAEGLVCEANACVGETGAPCAREADCQAALVCDTDVCKKAVGQACATGECATGLNCDAGTCKVRALGGCTAGQCATGLTCVAGQCRADAGKGCTADAECADGYFCDAGFCRGRLGATCGAGTCAANLQCENNRCVATAGGACGSGVDCASGLTCQDQVCRLPLNGACGPTAPCANGLTCTAGLCKKAPGQACVNTGECAANLTCDQGQCARPIGGGCGTGVPCGTGLVCDGGTCRRSASGPCAASDECASGLQCVSGVCKSPPGGPCILSADCPAGNVCSGGRCLGGVGTACTQNAQCDLSLVCEQQACRGTDYAPCLQNSDCRTGLTCDRGACIPPAPQLPPTKDLGASGADWTVSAATADDLGRVGSVGTNVLAIGDFNADGYGDLAIGAPLAPAGGFSQVGKVFVVFGSKNRPLSPQAINLAQPDSTTPRPIVLTGVQSSDNAGAAVAAVDIDGDGCTDLAIGVPGRNLSGTGTDEGEVVIVRGGRGLNGCPTFPTQDATIDASFSAYRIQGEKYANLGRSLASGDVNGDRVGDLFVAADTYGGGAGGSVSGGAAYLFIGSRTQWSTSAPKSQIQASTSMRVKSSALGDSLGSALALADVDGDGNDDLFALCPICSTASSSGSYGAILGLKGGPSVLGRAATNVPSGSTDYTYSTFDFAWFGPSTNRDRMSLAAGDVTGDGRAELFGAFITSSSSLAEVDGLLGRADFWTALPGGARVSTVTTANDWKLPDPVSSDYLGLRMAVGDIDGDHKKDLVVSASNNSTSAQRGSIYVFFGGTSALFGGTAGATTQAQMTILAPSLRQLGTVVALGDLNGDGHAEIAATSYSGSLSVSDLVFVVFGGTRP